MCAKVLPPAGRERAALTCERETRAARRVVQERKSRAHVAASGASGRVCAPLPAGRYLIASGQTGQGRMQAPTGMSLGIGWLAGWLASNLPTTGWRGCHATHALPPQQRRDGMVGFPCLRSCCPVPPCLSELAGGMLEPPRFTFSRLQQQHQQQPAGAARSLGLTDRQTNRRPLAKSELDAAGGTKGERGARA